MFNYPWCLQYGKGINQNKTKAVKYYKLSADFGNANAMYNYAWCLANVKGIDKNLAEAVKY
jgi:TPR repeat protein